MRTEKSLETESEKIRLKITMTMTATTTLTCSERNESKRMKYRKKRTYTQHFSTVCTVCVRVSEWLAGWLAD